MDGKQERRPVGYPARVPGGREGEALHQDRCRVAGCLATLTVEVRSMEEDTDRKHVALAQMEMHGIGFGGSSVPAPAPVPEPEPPPPPPAAPEAPPKTQMELEKNRLCQKRSSRNLSVFLGIKIL